MRQTLMTSSPRHVHSRACAQNSRHQNGAALTEEHVMQEFRGRQGRAYLFNSVYVPRSRPFSVGESAGASALERPSTQCAFGWAPSTAGTALVAAPTVGCFGFATAEEAHPAYIHQARPRAYAWSRFRGPAHRTLIVMSISAQTTNEA
jgi:hypothetical protein